MAQRKLDLSHSFACLFVLRFYVPVNSYGHVEKVRSILSQKI